MEEEDAEQRITYLLQEIDANICAAHRSATQICGTVRRHHQILRQIHEASQVWRPLFASFTQQSAGRRATRTPGGTDARTKATPGSTASGFYSVSASAVQGEGEDPSVVGSERTFRTTTLQRLAPGSAARGDGDDSTDSSLLSEPEPRLSRTPLLPKAGSRSRRKVQDTASSSVSDARTNWSTPAMSSPLRMGVLTEGNEQADRQPSTPNSDISSVAEYNSPGVSKNLMKMGAFEYTPPRGRRSKRMGSTDDSAMPTSPRMPRFSTVTATSASQESANDQSPSTRKSTQGSSRKRKRVESPVYPKTHHPSSLTPSLSSPHSFSSLRRKYSTADYSTPTRKRRAESSSQPSPAKSASQESQPAAHDDDDDEPLTPEFDMASPLLRTQLKAMTPHTPLSNRLVGVNLDVGSNSQEARLQEYDDSFNAGEPAPQFELALLPAAFQRGVGAVQISTLYSKFQTDDDNKPAISVDQMAEMLPEYGKQKIEILLDTLVSRRLLRPFVVEGTMFWQVPV